MKHSWLLGAVIILLACASIPGHAQTVAESAPAAALYFDLNKADKSIQEISTESLSLQYYDGSGISKDLPCTIYNWKQEVIAEFAMTKAFGLNQYNIKFSDVYSRWEKYETYRLVARNETGARYEFFFKLSETPKQEIAANIIVNPKFVDCGKTSGNLVAYYGDINGGKAPYDVTWFVLNDHRTKFLYQPRNYKIKDPGLTSTIEVDKDPDYYVIMYVKDACGSESHQVAHLVCEKGQKKVNTIFFENVAEQVKNLKGK